MLLTILTAANVSQAVNIDTVLVGNTGNTDDDTGYGAVDYEYNIGKYEVTAGQYTEFLNAVAETDTYDLYHDGGNYVGMWGPNYDEYGVGIERTGRLEAPLTVAE